MKYILTLISLFLALCSVNAQEKFTVSGFIKDAETGEALTGAYVIESNSGAAVSSNVYGFYSLTVKASELNLLVSFIGYSPEKIEFKLNEDKEIDFNLFLNNSLKEVIIEDSQSEAIEQKTQMSSVQLDMKKVKNLPVLLGETDLLKTLQLLPGIQSGTEGASGLYVRGGGPDQNLLLLDGVPIYNASHLFGFFSVFNADAIRDVELIKGGFPARYGGRLSSVIDVRMKEGNLNELHGEGSVGIISSKLTLEGPIKEGKSSFLISGRRTYIDLLARPIIRSQASQQGESGTGGYYFYDLNGKVNYVIGKKDRVFLSGYLGNDRAFSRFSSSSSPESREDIDARLEWGNAIVAGRWNHIFGPRLFSNVTATFSNYRFLTDFQVSTIGTENAQLNLLYDSGIRDWSGKMDFDYIPNPDLNLKFGTSIVNHRFTPGVNTYDLSVDEVSIDTTFGSEVIDANEFNGYLEANWKVNNHLKVNAGLHSSNFFVEGQQYLSLQPRLALRYLLSKKLSIKGSYANMTQFLHLLSNSTIGLPTDLWVPVTERIKPQVSDQVAIGMATTLKPGYQLTVEGYYKWMQNLIEYKDGASFQGTAENWQDKVEIGDGNSYGAEILLEKTQGKFTGWLGYTLSWANRQFDNINFGETFAYRFDRRHDIGLAFTYVKNERVDMGLVYVYGTGNAVTLPAGRYNGILPSQSLTGPGVPQFTTQVDEISERNGYRMPSYHRLDLGLNLHKKKKRGTRTWTLGIYNMYNRENPFFLFFDNVNGQNVLKQISLFPILPSISYGFKF